MACTCHVGQCAQLPWWLTRSQTENHVQSLANGQNAVQDDSDHRVTSELIKTLKKKSIDFAWQWR